jgi:glutathione synthase/RimK-type ligase-like ATP-grasp enzyme
MKQILVVGGHSTTPEDIQELHSFCDSIREAYPEAQIDSVTVDQLQFVIEPGDFKVLNAKTGQELREVDLVILRNKMRTYNSIAYSLSRYCQAADVRFFNDYSQYFPGTKIAQAVVFYEQKLPFIKTVYAMDHDVLVSLIKRELSLPFVLKDALGAKGSSNYLIKSYEELEQHLQAEPDTHFLAQEFCANDRDYRILIAGSEYLIIKRQGAGDTHLNNTSTGGSAALAPDEVPLQVIEQSKHLAEVMDLQVVGVDVMPKLDTNEFYFIETNSQPQVFTGAFPEEKRELMSRFLDRLMSDL